MYRVSVLSLSLCSDLCFMRQNGTTEEDSERRRLMGQAMMPSHHTPSPHVVEMNQSLFVPQVNQAQAFLDSLSQDAQEEEEETLLVSPDEARSMKTAPGSSQNAPESLGAPMAGDALTGAPLHGSNRRLSEGALTHEAAVSAAVEMAEYHLTPESSPRLSPVGGEGMPQEEIGLQEAMVTSKLDALQDGIDSLAASSPVLQGMEGGES